MMMDDARLLQEYISRRSASAFTELVQRHVDLVYSTALRMVHEPSLAEDIVQMVFVQLMSKASTIRQGNTLPGWLYRVTHCQAVNALRAEKIRRRYEAEARMQAQTVTNDTWETINPELDEAMATLNTEEQNVMVMRFFQERPWHDIGAALAVSEDTAQRRARQGLKKLRAYFSGKGIAVTSTALGLAVSANAVQAAPTGLASSVAVTALTKGIGGASLGGATLLKALIVKKAIAVWIGLALVATVTTSVVYTLKHKAHVAQVAANLNQGQVLHFTFDQDEGERVTDSSGMNNHGQVVGAQWVWDDQRGGAIQFAEKEQYISVINHKSLNPSHITLSAWIKVSLQNNIWRRIFDKNWAEGYAMSIGGQWKSQMYREKLVTEMAMNLNQNQGINFSNQIVTDGTWHHVVTTYDGMQQRMYVDGTLQDNVASWTGSIPSNSFDLLLGINLINPDPDVGEVGASLGGLIDDPMIFDRALSEKEVKYLYRSQHHGQ